MQKNGRVPATRARAKAKQEPAVPPPTSEQMVEFLQSQLADAHLVIGQKEMQVQRQAAMIAQLQAELGQRQMEAAVAEA